MIKLEQVLAAGAAAGALCACASDRVDFGGVMSPASSPSDAVACDQAAWSVAERVQPEYPRQLMTFLYLNQSRRDVRELTFSYDINPDGETRNIRFVSPEAFLDHRATQSAILAAAEALAQFRYDWAGAGAPAYTQGCALHFAFNASIPQN